MIGKLDNMLPCIIILKYFTYVNLTLVYNYCAVFACTIFYFEKPSIFLMEISKNDIFLNLVGISIVVNFIHIKLCWILQGEWMKSICMIFSICNTVKITPVSKREDIFYVLIIASEVPTAFKFYFFQEYSSFIKNHMYEIVAIKYLGK